MIRRHVGVMAFILAITLMISNTIVSTAYNNNIVSTEHNNNLYLNETKTVAEHDAKIPKSEPINTNDTTAEVIEKETEIVSKAPAKPAYSEDDLFYLAAAVCREAGGESEEIQLLVANVIINRVNSSVYPDTIYEVLTQKRQYGTMWRDGISFPDWATDDVKNQCYSVARRILDGERFCPENVLYQAEFKQGSGVYKEYPGYYFCYYE